MGVRSKGACARSAGVRRGGRRASSAGAAIGSTRSCSSTRPGRPWPWRTSTSASLAWLSRKGIESTTSSSMSGCAAVKDCSCGTRIWRAKVGGDVTRKRCSLCRRRWCWGMAASKASAWLTCCRYSRPAAVSASARAARTKTGVPSKSSTAATRLLTALALTASSSAARSKLPSRAAASKARRPSMEGKRSSAAIGAQSMPRDSRDSRDSRYSRYSRTSEPARTPSNRMRRARSTRLRHWPAAWRMAAASTTGSASVKSRVTVLKSSKRSLMPMVRPA